MFHSKVTIFKGRWIPVEYMPWMADILGEDEGPLHCCNPQCRAEVGVWSWKTLLHHERSGVATDLPLIGIDKAKVAVAPSPTARGSLTRLGSNSNASSAENTPRDRETLTPRDSRDSLSTPRGPAMSVATPHASFLNRGGSAGGLFTFPGPTSPATSTVSS
jgi:hypothetical protein